MPAITLGYSQIEQQIRVIRRRRNWLTVQQAVYVCGGVMLLGAALLVVLAVRAERLAFTVAFWATVASILLSALAAGRSIWQRWIRPAETPRWIDRVGELDDRLTTLVAHRGTHPPPRLMATVVSQLFALRYRWEPATLVPRRVPRSLYFFLLAAMALIATSFLERPPAAPHPFPHTAAHPNAPADEPDGRLVRVQGRTTGAAHGARDANAGGDGAAAPDRARPGSRAGTGSGAARGSGPEHRMHGTKQPGRSGAREQMAPGGGGDAMREQMESALPDRVQNLIRQALRQPPLESQEPRTGQERMQAKRGQPGQQPGNKQQREQLARQDAQAPGRPRPIAATPPQQSVDNAASGRGTNRGGGGGQGTSGIYSTQAPAGQENAGRKFELKLTLVGQSSGATMEPQKAHRGDVGDVGLPAEHPTTDVPLNPIQRADEALVRGEIPAEHETMIKRIFSRSDEQGIEESTGRAGSRKTNEPGTTDAGPGTRNR